MKRAGTAKRGLLLTLAAVAVIACLTGCVNSRKVNGDAPALSEITEHLLEITYTEDFDWTKAEAPDFSGFACSGVQNGPYRGRNYDWEYSDSDICVVHAAASANRPHASIGVADLSFLESRRKGYDTDKIPFLTVDGINDAGVCIQINVMPYGENGALSHTQSTEDDLYSTCVVRYLLDNAASVEEALALLEAKDIHSEMGEYSEAHWMISGPASNTEKTLRTVVAEVFPEGLHVTEDFIDNKPIMTNFNVSTFDGSIESIGFGAGYERWQILNENYEQASSVAGTFALMEKVYYSGFYDLYRDRFWYSDYNEVDLSLCYKKNELKAMLGEEVYDFYMEKYGGVYYNPALYDGETALNGDAERAGILKAAVQLASEYYAAQNKKDGSLWISVHTAVYDLENLTLDIRIFEAQEQYHFSLTK